MQKFEPEPLGIKLPAVVCFKDGAILQGKNFSPLDLSGGCSNSMNASVLSFEIVITLALPTLSVVAMNQRFFLLPDFRFSVSYSILKLG